MRDHMTYQEALTWGIKTLERMALNPNMNLNYAEAQQVAAGLSVLTNKTFVVTERNSISGRRYYITIKQEKQHNKQTGGTL